MAAGRQGKESQLSACASALVVRLRRPLSRSTPIWTCCLSGLLLPIATLCCYSGAFTNGARLEHRRAGGGGGGKGRAKRGGQLKGLLMQWWCGGVLGHDETNERENTRTRGEERRQAGTRKNASAAVTPAIKHSALC